MFVNQFIPKNLPSRFDTLQAIPYPHFSWSQSQTGEPIRAWAADLYQGSRWVSIASDTIGRLTAYLTGKGKTNSFTQDIFESNDWLVAQAKQKGIILWSVAVVPSCIHLRSEENQVRASWNIWAWKLALSWLWSADCKGHSYSCLYRRPRKKIRLITTY